MSFSTIDRISSSESSFPSLNLFVADEFHSFITAAMLTFSDGSNVSVSALNNDGSAKVVNFPARVSKTLRMTVISAASSTYNSGLAEIVVFGSLSVPLSLRASSTRLTVERQHSAGQRHFHQRRRCELDDPRILFPRC